MGERLFSTQRRRGAKGAEKTWTRVATDFQAIAWEKGILSCGGVEEAAEFGHKRAEVGCLDLSQASSELVSAIFLSPYESALLGF